MTTTTETKGFIRLYGICHLEISDIDSLKLAYKCLDILEKRMRMKEDKEDLKK